MTVQEKEVRGTELRQDWPPCFLPARLTQTPPLLPFGLLQWKSLAPWNKNSTEPRDFVPDNKTVDPHRRPGHVSWLWAAHKVRSTPPSLPQSVTNPLLHSPDAGAPLTDVYRKGKERLYNPGHYKYVCTAACSF